MRPLVHHRHARDHRFEDPPAAILAPVFLVVNRRNFRLSDKKRNVAEAMVPGASVSGVARRYGITAPLLFRWKCELAPPKPEPVFLSVAVSDGPDAVGVAPHLPAVPASAMASPPVIVEQPHDEIEVELVVGPRMRFSRDTDPALVRTMIAMLEGAAS